jgi:hypothetical protein
MKPGTYAVWLLPVACAWNWEKAFLRLQRPVRVVPKRLGRAASYRILVAERQPERQVDDQRTFLAFASNSGLARAAHFEGDFHLLKVQSAADTQVNGRGFKSNAKRMSTLD